MALIDRAVLEEKIFEKWWTTDGRQTMGILKAHLVSQGSDKLTKADDFAT
ncbi:MAG: hypothetical protein AB2693_07310 [Candidatus Thiodiazotropha sp.]